MGEDLSYTRTALRCRTLAADADPSLARVLKALADDCDRKARDRSAGWFTRYPPRPAAKSSFAS